MTIKSSSIPITIRGRYFWRGDERFFIRGVVYQPWDDAKHDGVNDPIADDRLLELEQNCVLLKELGVNTLYVYQIDNQKQHDEAMKLLESAGIYVVAGVCTPSCCINRVKPYESYNTAKVSSLLRTAGIMAAYPNTLAITASNMLVNGRGHLHVAPVLKAVIRDLKRYLACSHEIKGTRLLPVGYANAAAPNINYQTDFQEYLYSGEKETTVDFWGLADWGWTGKSNIQISGWLRLISHYERFAIPSFLCEYGANTAKIRSLDETKVLYSDPMARVFSGGCVYEFLDSANNYGLVAKNASDKRWFEFRTEIDGKIIERRETDAGDFYIYQDFANYKAALAESADNNQPSWDPMEREAEERHTIDVTQKTWSWGSEYQIPATCIDWDNIGELVGRQEEEVQTTTQRLESVSIT